MPTNAPVLYPASHQQRIDEVAKSTPKPKPAKKRARRPRTTKKTPRKK